MLEVRVVFSVSLPSGGISREVVSAYWKQYISIFNWLRHCIRHVSCSGNRRNLRIRAHERAQFYSVSRVPLSFFFFSPAHCYRHPASLQIKRTAHVSFCLQLFIHNFAGATWEPQSSEGGTRKRSKINDGALREEAASCSLLSVLRSVSVFAPCFSALSFLLHSCYSTLRQMAKARRKINIFCPRQGVEV